MQYRITVLRKARNPHFFKSLILFSGSSRYDHAFKYASLSFVFQFTFASNAATIIGGCLVTNKYKMRLPAAFISAFVISVSLYYKYTACSNMVTARFVIITVSLCYTILLIFSIDCLTIIPQSLAKSILTTCKFPYYVSFSGHYPSIDSPVDLVRPERVAVSISILQQHYYVC